MVFFFVYTFVCSVMGGGQVRLCNKVCCLETSGFCTFFVVKTFLCVVMLNAICVYMSDSTSLPFFCESH